MLSEFDKVTILNDFPNIKLSYENITHKKVYNSDVILAIPTGTKCFAWFTTLNDKMVCLIMELTIHKQVTDIKVINACFSEQLAYGTILYGTYLYISNNKFFFIEDIFSYKGDNVERLCWGEKLSKINNMLKKELRQMSYNNSFIVFGLPLMCKTNEEMERKFEKITYKIETIQYKLFKRVNNYLFMDYNNYIYKKPIEIAVKPAYISKPIEKYNCSIQPKRENVFIIRPDIQDDIYFIYCFNNEFKEEKIGNPHIPDYTCSVMMNKLFRIIKENYNLDALEESDDEDEYENENIDKFVHLNKSLKMVCQFNHKFKKWVPIRVANDDAKIVTTQELTNIYNYYDQNKNKNKHKYN
jgi:hypothetical protein